jgi:hypothetical protein
MQFKALVALTLATVAIAAPSNLEARQGQCNTGPVQCCNSVQRADSEAASKLLGLLGIVVQDVSIPIGITCTPITVIGLPGNSWLVYLSKLCIIIVFPLLPFYAVALLNPSAARTTRTVRNPLTFTQRILTDSHCRGCRCYWMHPHQHQRLSTICLTKEIPANSVGPGSGGTSCSLDYRLGSSSIVPLALLRLYMSPSGFLPPFTFSYLSLFFTRLYRRMLPDYDFFRSIFHLLKVELNLEIKSQTLTNMIGASAPCVHQLSAPCRSVLRIAFLEMSTRSRVYSD